MISIFKYLSARSRLKEINKTIEVMGGDASPPILLAQRDMNINETTYYYYRFWAEIIYILIFVGLCGIIYGVMDEEDLRTLWSGISSWYAQTVAWGQLQAETIYQSISR
jgi:hypothetical protein